MEPQLIQLNYFFEHLVAIKGPISVQALQDLSSLASSENEASFLENLASGNGRLRWIDLFETCSSLVNKVSVHFLVCNMVANHPRSYSIASCKEMVESELHVCVGRFLYDHNGQTEAGVCSDFLTSVEAGELLLFEWRCHTA